MSLEFPPVNLALSTTSPNIANQAARNPETDSPVIDEAVSRGFESVFLSLLIKSMRTSMTSEGLFGSESSDTLGGLFDLYMGQHLAEASGIGIGHMLNAYKTETQIEESQFDEPTNAPDTQSKAR